MLAAPVLQHGLSMPPKPPDSDPSELRRRAQRAAIVRAIHAIPSGQVRAYGEVAAAAGLPGRARLVARVLSEGDEPALPWHRVVRAGLRIAFPAGSAGALEQSARLRAEGVQVDGLKVRAAVRGETSSDLDAAVWGVPLR
jgi:methylated-DNA-protein-cysteine methyltransferase-like protein